jgi:hypothetical protein
VGTGGGIKIVDGEEAVDNGQLGVVEPAEQENASQQFAPVAGWLGAHGSSFSSR